MTASEVETGDTANQAPKITENKVDDGIIIAFRRLQRNHENVSQEPEHCHNCNDFRRRVLSKRLSRVLPIFRFKSKPLNIRSELFYL